jgi:hypothetical protein
MKFLNGQLQLDSSLTGTTALFTSGLTVGSAQISSGMTRGVLFNNTLTATSGSDILVGHDINPTFLGNTSANWHTLRLWQPLNQYGDNRPYMSWKYGTEYDVFRMFMDSNWKVNFKSTGQALGFVFTGGNILINTTTDAGYRLDVNGTTRITGAGSTSSSTSLLVMNSSSTTTLNVRDDGVVIIPGSTVLQGFTQIGLVQFYPVLDGGYTTSSSGRALRVDTTFNNTVSSTYAYQFGAFSLETGTASTINGTSVIATLAPTSGNQTFTALNVVSAIDATGTYSGIVRGIFYNSVLTSMTGVTHRAIETTSGDVIFNGGNVGIGTSNPTSNLTISSSSAPTLRLENTANLGTTLWSGTTIASIDFSYTDPSGPGTLGRISLVGGSNSSGGAAEGDLVFNTTPVFGSLTEKIRIKGGGNVLIGTTTDAGFKLDVNGTLRVQGNTTLNGTLSIGNGSFSYSVNPNDSFTISGNQGLILNHGNGNAGGVVLGASTSPNFTVSVSNSIRNGVSISRPVTTITGTTGLTYNSIIINNVIDYTNATSSMARGLYINPTLTSVTDFRAIETTVGNVLLCTTSGNVLIGTSTTNNSRLLVGGTVSGATLSTTRAVHINPTLLATGNTTTLIGLDIQPNFNRSSYTGTTALALRVSGGTQIIGSGSTGTTLSVFSVDGSSGRLFDVSDDLSSTLFSVNTIAGLPVIEAFANNAVVMGKYNQNTLVVSGTSVGIGTSSPQAKLDVNGTMLLGSLSGDPSGANGMIYYNTTTNKFRGYENGAWGNLIG